MKTKLMTALLTVTSAIFAQEQMPTSNDLPLELNRSWLNIEQPRSWFGYMRLGASDSRPNEITNVHPGLGLGCRFGLPFGALDLSASYAGNDVRGKGSYFYTVPRVAYLMYLTPDKGQSFYAGPGLAYGRLKTLEDETFNGIVPSLSVGYEMNRLNNWRSFIQVDVSQPAFSTDTVSPYLHTASADLGPIVEFSVGFGY